MAKSKSRGNYEVGYGKPPKTSQFKKGQSGNSKGRPKGHNNFKTDLTEALNARVIINENGKRKSITSQRAAILRLREKALKGDARSLDRLLELARIYNSDEVSADVTETLAPSDQAILENFKDRLLSRRPDGDSPPQDMKKKDDKDE
jgi:hypothetical protein